MTVSLSAGAGGHGDEDGVSPGGPCALLPSYLSLGTWLLCEFQHPQQADFCRYPIWLPERPASHRPLPSCPRESSLLLPPVTKFHSECPALQQLASRAQQPGAAQRIVRDSRLQWAWDLQHASSEHGTGAAGLESLGVSVLTRTFVSAHLQGHPQLCQSPTPYY